MNNRERKKVAKRSAGAFFNGLRKVLEAHRDAKGEPPEFLGNELGWHLRLHLVELLGDEKRWIKQSRWVDDIGWHHFSPAASGDEGLLVELGILWSGPATNAAAAMLPSPLSLVARMPQHGKLEGRYEIKVVVGGETFMFGSRQVKIIGDRTARAPAPEMWPSLHRAASAGDTSRLKALLIEEPGAPGTAFGGVTPLMLAVLFGHNEAVHALLRNGADPEVRTSVGCTAVMLACRYGYADIVFALLDHGASSETEDRYGQTPLSLAEAGFRSSAGEARERFRRLLEVIKR